MGMGSPKQSPSQAQLCPHSVTARRLIGLALGAHTLRAWRWWRRVVDSEEPLDAPDHTTNRCSDDCADRAGNAIALSCAMLEAARETTLSLGRDWCCYGGDDDAYIEDSRSHETTPLILFGQ